MKYFDKFWGINEHISPLEIALRATVMFIIILALLKISGMRTFGKGSSFDTTVTILLGGILSRGVVGATPFLSSVAGGLMLVLIHRAISWYSQRNKKFEHGVKGQSKLIFNNGKFIEKNLQRYRISQDDVYEELRLQCNQSDFKQIAMAFVEKTGEISFIKYAQ